MSQPNPTPEINAMLGLADLLGASKFVPADNDAEITLTPTGRVIGIHAELDDDGKRVCWVVSLTVRVETVPHDPLELGGQLARLFYDTAARIASKLSEAAA